jgi:hypothetical protein
MIEFHFKSDRKKKTQKREFVNVLRVQYCTSAVAKSQQSFLAQSLQVLFQENMYIVYSSRSWQDLLAPGRLVHSLVVVLVTVPR